MLGKLAKFRLKIKPYELRSDSRSVSKLVEPTLLLHFRHINAGLGVVTVLYNLMLAVLRVSGAY